MVVLQKQMEVQQARNFARTGMCKSMLHPKPRFIATLALAPRNSPELNYVPRWSRECFAKQRGWSPCSMILDDDALLLKTGAPPHWYQSKQGEVGPNNNKRTTNNVQKDDSQRVWMLPAAGSSEATKRPLSRQLESRRIMTGASKRWLLIKVFPIFFQELNIPSAKCSSDEAHTERKCIMKSTKPFSMKLYLIVFF